ncbi:hypothetical protein QQG55_12085 [Brugia pahangi]
MHKILAYFNMLLLIAVILNDSKNIGAVIVPYFRHQRHPFREVLRQPLLIVPVADRDRYLSGTMLMTQKRSQPDNDFDYADDFDPTQIFL